MIMQNKLFGTFSPCADYSIGYVASVYALYIIGVVADYQISFGTFCDILTTYEVRIV